MPKKGYKQTDEHRAKLSAAINGRTPEQQAAATAQAVERNKRRTGWAHTPESKEKMRQARLGKPLPEVQRAKIANSLLGNQHTKGKTLTPEHRAKISAAGIGRTPTPETRAKYRARWEKWREEYPTTITRGYQTSRDALTGKPRTGLHRQVMQAHLGRALEAREVVHHVDGDKMNNSLSNLHLCQFNSHAKIHAQLEKVAFELVKRGLIVFSDGEYQIADLDK